MEGRIVWWNAKRTCGLVSVTENGQIQNYWLLLSRIRTAPEKIEPGDIAIFTQTLPALRPELLPVAVGVVVQKQKPIDAGAEALASGAGAV